MTADGLGELSKLTADLSKAGPSVGAQAALAVRKAAHDVEAEAKRLVPVDTGATRNSIGTDFTGDGRNGTMTATIGPTTNYAPYLEFGTRRMAPRAFMGPALDRVGPEFSAAIAQIGGEIL